MLQVLRSSDLEEIVKLSTNKNKSGNTETISPCNLTLLSKCKVYSINIIDYNTKPNKSRRKILSNIYLDSRINHDMFTLSDVNTEKILVITSRVTKHRATKKNY